MVPSENAKLILALGGVTAQLSGLSLLVYRQSRMIVSQLKYTREDFASDLDEQFGKYESTVTWLRALPPEQLRFAFMYIEQRIATLSKRHGAMFGPIEKLGLLPALVACVLQLSVIANPSFVFWGAGVVIVVFYLLGLWMLGLKFQLQLYSHLLEASLDVDASAIQARIPSGTNA